MDRISGSYVEIPLDRSIHGAELFVPPESRGIVIFAHGGGSSRHSPRNQFVAAKLHEHLIGTLLLDLLTDREERDHAARYNIDLITHRLVEATLWLKGQPQAQGLPLGYFGASTGAAAALKAAAILGNEIKAVVSRGGRPDLAEGDLQLVRSATLLIVGGEDREVIRLNKAALARLPSNSELSIIPHAGHLFEETGKLENVAELAAYWFVRFLNSIDNDQAVNS
jgi:putative phosphoribosyl transferase